MKIKTYNKIISLSTIVFLFCGQLNAQPLDRDVVVTKDYKPIIQDAKRIEIQPDIKDTVRIKPTFKYSIYPIAAKSSFEVRPIKAAKLVGIPIPEIYNYHIKGGLGNRHLPMLEILANNLRSNKHLIGASLELNNIEGKIKLGNNEKVNASENNLRLTGFGKKFLDNANIEGSIGLEHHKSHYYGIDTSTISTDMPQARDIKQNVNTFFASGKVYSTALNPKYSYSLGINERYTWDRYDFFENNINIFTNNIFALDKTDIHLDADLTILSNNLNNDSITNSSYIAIAPYFANQLGDFRYRFGFKLTIETDDANAYFHPLGGIEYSMADDDIITAFLNLEGGYSPNTYKEILNENPFVAPGTMVRPSDNRIKVTGGIKGGISKNLFYQMDAEISNTKDQLLYVIDTVGIYNNFYTILYGDVDKIKLGTSLKYSIKDKLDIFLNGNKNIYEAGTEPYAWHLPLWDISLKSSYNIQEKVVLGAVFNLIGKRYARDLNEQALELKPFATFDLKADYFFSKALSAFISIRNLNSSQYDLWYNYPYFKTMILIGASYGF